MILLKLLFFLFLAKIKMCICIRTYVKHFIVTDTILLFFQTPLPVFKVSKTYYWYRHKEWTDVVLLDYAQLAVISVLPKYSRSFNPENLKVLMSSQVIDPYWVPELCTTGLHNCFTSVLCWLTQSWKEHLIFNNRKQEVNKMKYFWLRQYDTVWLLWELP